MSGRSEARQAKEYLGRLLREHPRIAQGLGVQGGEVPLGFAIRAYGERLETKISDLDRQRKRVPGFMGSPGGYLPDPRIERERDRLAADRLALALFPHLARLRERHDPELRQRVHQTTAQALELRLRSARGVRLHKIMVRPYVPDDWPRCKVVADVELRVAVPHLPHRLPNAVSSVLREAGPLGKAFEAGTEALISGTPQRFLADVEYEMRWHRDWIGLLYLDWEKQTLSTRAPPHHQERDVWYWIGTVSEAFLTAVDILTMVGLARRAVVGAAASLARRGAARSALRGALSTELHQMEELARVAAKTRPRGLAAEESALRAPAPREVSTSRIPGTGGPRGARAVEGLDSAGVGRPRGRRPDPRQRGLDSPHGAGSESIPARNPARFEEGLDRHQVTGRSSSGRGTAPGSRATRRSARGSGAGAGRPVPRSRSITGPLEQDLETAGTGMIRRIERGRDVDGAKWYRIEGELGPKIPRNNLENRLPPGSKVGLPGYDRAHLWGRQFGDEAVAGIAYMPARVNRRWQTKIEGFLRSVRADAARLNRRVVLDARVETHPASALWSGQARRHGAEVVRRVQYEVRLVARDGSRTLTRRVTLDVPPTAHGVARASVPAGLRGELESLALPY